MLARVKDVMTALEHCFLLEVRSRLNFATMLAIYKSGFTRIPVYESSRQNIKGILYVKDLILVDPDDETELSAVLAFRCATACPGFLLMCRLKWDICLYPCATFQSFACKVASKLRRQLGKHVRMLDTTCPASLHAFPIDVSRMALRRVVFLNDCAVTHQQS